MRRLLAHTHAYNSCFYPTRLRQFHRRARPNQLLHAQMYRVILSNASRTSWKRFTSRWSLHRLYRCHLLQPLFRCVVCFPRHRRPLRAAFGRRDVTQLTHCAFPSTQTQALEASFSNVPMNPAKDGDNSAASNASDIPPGPAGQIEIPFIPAHKRQTLSNQQNCELMDDTIVIVGQAGTRQRKRKRDKARVTSTSQLKSGTQSTGAETSPSIGGHDQEAEVFDYSSVPNLLDDESKHGDTRGGHEEDERTKKKQRHGKGMPTSSPDRQLKQKCHWYMLWFLRGICSVFTMVPVQYLLLAPWKTKFRRIHVIHSLFTID